MTVIYVNDTLIDLNSDFVLAYTISKVEFNDLSLRKVSYTNSLKVPRTPTNDVVFGFAGEEKSFSTTPYRKHPCKVVQNGVQTIPDGECWVTDSDAISITLAIYENVINVFDNITGRKLNELSHISISAWDAAGIDGHRLNTSGLIAAVLNWGRAGAIYQLDYFLPCWFYHSFVTEVLELTGLTLSGAVLTDTRFTDLVIPYSRPKFEYPLADNELYQLTSPLAFLSFQYGYSFTVDGTTEYEADVASLGGGTTNKWEIDGNELVLKDTGRGSIRWLTLSAVAPANTAGWISAWNPGEQLALILEIYHPTEGYTYQWVYQAQESFNGPAPVDAVAFLVGSATQVIVIGDGTRIRLYVDNGTSNVGVAHTTGIGSPFSLGLTATATTTIDRAAVVWMQLVPDLSMTEILTDFNVRFGVVYKQIGGTLYLKTLEEIIADRANAVDWTTKRANKKEDKISLRTSYGQRNTMKYRDEADDPDVGTGAFVLDNDTLQQEKNIYTSPFGNAKTATYSGGKKALVNVYENATTGITDFENEPGLRLLTLRAKEAGEGTITFNAVARSDYKVGYFVDPLQTKDTGFQYFLDQKYAGLSSALQKAKTVTHSYALNELDIANYDPHKLIYDDGCYYIVNKISNYIPGRITKVELLKV